MSYRHEPVLLQEVLCGLNPQPGQNFIDGTVGGGGHALAILKATAPNGRLLAFDRDQVALSAARENLAQFGDRVIFIHDSYSNLANYVERHKFSPVNGILFDLGLSSAQLDDGDRGFSFKNIGPLDLRFNTSAGRSASELLNNESETELVRIFKEYGEEPQAGKLARAIVAERRLHPFTTTTDLLSVVERVKGSGRRSINPATLVWQALRIAVNNELKELTVGLKSGIQVLQLEGRFAIISFHSGEDKIVKDFFRRESKDCLCPPSVPVCRCYHKAALKLITRKPVMASTIELNKNSRARSAKLRLAQKLNSI